MSVKGRIRISEVERVDPNALLDSVIRKRLEDKSLHPRCRAKQFICLFQASRCAARAQNYFTAGAAPAFSARFV